MSAFSRTSILIAAATTTALVVSGCTRDSESESAHVGTPATAASTATELADAQPSTAESAPEDPAANARGLYEKVVSNPSAIVFNYPHEDRGPMNRTPGTPSGFQYAIVEATGDNTPELLVRRGSYEINPVAVFTTANNGKDLVTIEDVLIDGAASAGGSRAHTMGMQSGAGLIQVEGMSMDQTHNATVFQIQGTHLMAGEKNSFSVVGGGLPSDAVEITWTDTADTSALDAMASAAPAAQPAAGGSGPHPTLPADAPAAAPGEGGSVAAPLAANDAGKCTYRQKTSSTSGAAADVPSSVTGTVRKVTAAQLMGGQPTPNGEPGTQEFWVLELDSPTTLSGKKSGTPGDVHFHGDQNCLSLQAGAAWSGYENKKVTVPFDSSRGWWQSDAGMPLGLLRADFTPADVR